MTSLPEYLKMKPVDQYCVEVEGIPFSIPETSLDTTVGELLVFAIEEDTKRSLTAYLTAKYADNGFGGKVPYALLEDETKLSKQVINEYLEFEMELDYKLKGRTKAQDALAVPVSVVVSLLMDVEPDDTL